MDGKLVKIEDIEEEKYLIDLFNFNLSEEDKKEIEYFNISINEALNLIINDTEELYFYYNEHNVLMIIFGMKIENEIGRPFILKSNNFEIKKFKKDFFSISKYFLDIEFEKKVKYMEIFKPVRNFNNNNNNFLHRLGFKLEEEIYFLEDNKFNKYKKEKR